MSFSASFLFQGQSVSDPFPAVSKRVVGGVNCEGKTEGQGRETLAQKRNQTMSFLSLGACKHLIGIWQMFSSRSQDLAL